jgi:hypothetical protein
LKRTILAALCAAAGAPALALEPFRIYDQFTEAVASPDRWLAGERVLAVHNGGLHLMQRAWPVTTSDIGAIFSNWSDNFANPGAITAIRTRVNVRALEVSTCASNPAFSQARARIVGGFFNAGNPVPGTQIDDVTAQLRLNRASNSADPAGVLRVQGLLSRCTNNDCSTTIVIGNVVELGTVSLGQPTVIEMRWDKPGKTFHFARDRGAYAGTVAYAESDALPPSNLFRQLSTRVDLPNCQSAPRAAAMVDVRFDNVQVNQSAAP